MSESDLSLFEPTYDEWATALKREYSARRKLARRMAELGSSRWPSPTASDSDRRTDSSASREGSASLTEEAANWPTPSARGWKGSPSELTRPDGKSRLDQLDRVAENWQTPKVSRGAWTRDNGEVGAERLSLDGQARNWPSPRVEDAESAGHHPNATDSLQMLARQWPTPTATDAVSNTRTNRSMSAGAVVRPILSTFSRYFRPVHTTETSGHECSPKCRRLNPLFVEWLMAWPPGWTVSDSPVTAWSQYLRRWRLYLFGFDICERSHE